MNHFRVVNRMFGEIGKKIKAMLLEIDLAKDIAKGDFLFD